MTAPVVTAAAGSLVGARVKVAARDINVSYGDKQALFDVSLDAPDRSVTAFIGPSGCGKTTFLRCINRMNDTIEGCRVTGSLQIDGKEAYGRDVDPVVLRSTWDYHRVPTMFTALRERAAACDGCSVPDTCVNGLSQSQYDARAVR